MKLESFALIGALLGLVLGLLAFLQPLALGFLLTVGVSLFSLGAVAYFIALGAAAITWGKE